MRIAKHRCMLQHWGKLTNVFIHEYNPWAPSFPCLNALTQYHNGNMLKKHAIRGQEERHHNTFSVLSGGHAGHLFCVYTYYMKYFQHFLKRIDLAIHMERGPHEYKCEFVWITSGACMHTWRADIVMKFAGVLFWEYSYINHAWNEPGDWY